MYKMVNGKKVAVPAAEAAAIQAEWAANAAARAKDLSDNGYKYSRQAEYPPLQDQLDYIYNYGIDAWKADMIKPIKDKYPKPV